MNSGTPPIQGAVDLNLLRGGSRAKQLQFEEEQLRQQGLLCKCGERIEKDGVQLVGMWSGTVGTPQGPQDGAAVIQAIFCSRSCLEFVGAVREGLDFQLPDGSVYRGRSIAIRDVAPIQWLDQLTSTE